MQVTRIRLGIQFFLILVFLFACGSPQVETSLPSTTTDSLSEVATEILKTNQPPEPADIIFHDGAVITIEKDQPQAEAVAIRGNLIQAVGSNEEILALQGSNTTVIDLQGKTLMPGFAEGHTHYTRRGSEDGIPLETMMQNLLAFGLTSITEMSSTDEYLTMVLEAERQGEVDVRLNIFARYNCPYLENGKTVGCTNWYKEHAPILDPSHMVRVVGVKIFVDGAGTPERGCTYNSFLWPENITDYWPNIWECCGTPYGDLYLSEEQLTTVLQDVQNRGYRGAFHAMGDAGIEVTLNAIENVLDGQTNAMYRHQIQHNSLVRTDMIDRYLQLDILASVRGAFNTCETDWYEGAFGEEHYAWNATRYELANLGVHTYLEGDFGSGDIYDLTRFTPLNPIPSLYGYVTHQQLRSDGSACIPPEWLARHKISVERALEMMTIEPAYAVSMEDYIGSIKPGKYADLIILSDNPLTIDPDKLIDLKVWMTMVNGEAKYCAQGHEEFCQKTSETDTTAQPTSSNAQATSTSTLTTPVTVQTVKVKFDCDSKGGPAATYSSGDFLLTTIDWAAKTEEQVNNFLNAVQYAIYVDGKQIQSNIEHDHVEILADRQLFSTLTYFDVGHLQPGKYEIRTVLTFNQKITDGFDEYGPGAQNSQIEGTCTVVIE